LRQYAAEQLASIGENEAMGDAHCAFFAELAANQMQALYRGDHSKMLADLDNLRAAWRWAVNHLRLEDIRKMLFPMGWFYDLRAYYPESVAAIRLAVDALHMSDPRGLQGIVYGKALAAYGIRGQRLYGADHGRPYLRQGLEIMRRLGAREDLAWPQILSLFHYSAVADPELQQSYEKYCLDSLATFEEMNDPYGVAFTLVVLGSNYRQHDRYAEAQLSIERGLAMSRSLDDREGMAHALRRLGELTLYLGRYDEACENFQEEAAQWGELRLPRLEAEALRSLGETYLAQEDFERADQALKESLSGFEQVGDQGNALLSLLDLVRLALLQEQPQIAHRLLQEARSIMGGRQDREEQAQWWLLSGRAYLQQNNLEIAHLVLSRALEYSFQGSRLTLVRTTLDLADLKLHQGDEENAARLTGFAQSHSGMPAALKQQRLEPLQAKLSAALEDDLLAALYGEGAALDAQAIAKMASVEITSM
jgi:tetratricopeptide (TPR) repeat protein